MATITNLIKLLREYKMIISIVILIFTDLIIPIINYYTIDSETAIISIVVDFALDFISLILFSWYIITQTNRNVKRIKKLP